MRVVVTNTAQVNRKLSTRVKHVQRPGGSQRFVNPSRTHDRIPAVIRPDE